MSVLHRPVESATQSGRRHPKIGRPEADLRPVEQPLASSVPNPATVSAGAPVVALMVREDGVLMLMRRGLTNKVIATRLGISVNTVKKHLSSVFDKRGLHRRRQTFD